MEYKENPTKEDLVEYFADRIDIRKLTERETLRLMDVAEEDIDKIYAYPFATLAEREAALAAADKATWNNIFKQSISKSAKYKLAGNSIVVSCLYHIFRKIFVDTETERTLFDFD